MASKTIQRLPDVKSLCDILPKGTEGGKEFSRIIDLLLFHEARRNGKTITIFNDAAGDYSGLDSFESNAFRKFGTTGYQYKFYPSPLSENHRADIAESLKKAAANQKKLRLKKWILITPQDFLESTSRKTGGDVTWFEGLREKYLGKFEIEHWGHINILALLIQTRFLCLRYYPDLINEGSQCKKTIEDTRKRYDSNLTKLHRDIQFVGMSVYKPEATKGVPMEHIYIPLAVVPEGTDERNPNIERSDPLSFLSPGNKCMILGDPGSGKSTLLRFLSMAGISGPLQKRYRAKRDKRCPIVVILRSYAEELKSRNNLSLIDYIQESVQGDFNLNSADLDFFEYYLEAGQAILFFDGLDELPYSRFKQKVRDQILSIITTYPGNTVIVTSRIIGYKNPYRFDEKEFKHYRLTRLRLPEIEQFVNDWYRVRIENKKEREHNVQDLIRILRDDRNIAIRELAENPLLLTIATLVHRIDAVLPDERVVLYQKCTETLLNTWHTSKYRGEEVANKGKVERRNKHRMEEIAYWMQSRNANPKKEPRTIVSYKELKDFLTTYIETVEKPVDNDMEPVDLAIQFLDFVKKRAGLLIEIGDNKYSFVHLTFQEYLSSTRIIYNCEMDGVVKIWETIGDFCCDDRWHEVIRLLVAGLQADDSQRYLIRKLLVGTAKKQDAMKARLMGGLIMDGIEAAEEREQEIINLVIRSAMNVNNADQFQPLISILRAFLGKNKANHVKVASEIKRVWKQNVKNKNSITLLLIACSAGLNEKEFNELTDEIQKGGNENFDNFRYFFDKNVGQKSTDHINAVMKNLWELQRYYATISPYMNFVAASFKSLNFSLGSDISAERNFYEHLYVLSSSVGYGPHIHFTYNTLKICEYERETISNLSMHVSGIMLNLEMAIDKRTDKHKDREEHWFRMNHLSSALNSVRNPAVPQEKDMLRIREHISYPIQPHNYYGDMFPWGSVLSNPSLYEPILSVICDLFKLEPRMQWMETLKVCFLPQVPKRIIAIYEDAWREKVIAAFRSGNFIEADVFYAAGMLLFDVWCFICGFNNGPGDSLYKDIAELSRTIDEPPLCIAHCIRDIAYGDESRCKDLLEMLKSDDPQYRHIFEEGQWEPKLKATAKPIKTKKKKVAK